MRERGSAVLHLRDLLFQGHLRNQVCDPLICGKSGILPSRRSLPQHAHRETRNDIKRNRDKCFTKADFRTLTSPKVARNHLSTRRRISQLWRSTRPSEGDCEPSNWASPGVNLARGLEMRHLRFLLGTASLLLGIWAQALRAQIQQGASGTPTIRVTSRLVFLDVTVLDKKGRPVVSGLTKDDFTIIEDRKAAGFFRLSAADSHRQRD